MYYKYHLVSFYLLLMSHLFWCLGVLLVGTNHSAVGVLVELDCFFLVEFRRNNSLTQSNLQEYSHFSSTGAARVVPINTPMINNGL